MPNKILKVKSAKYEMLEIIGRGGFGNVYRAEDQTNLRKVAIKVCDLWLEHFFLAKIHQNTN